MPKTMISFSRLRGVGISNGEHSKASRIQGSFAESISMEAGDASSVLGISEDCDCDCDCDASSTSSSSEEDSSPHIHSSQQGSFPSCPPSVEQKKSLGVVSMPLPVVFEEEDECDISVSNIDDNEKEEEQEDGEGHEEKVVEEGTKTVDVDPQKRNNPEEAMTTKDTIESGFYYSSSKTVCSNMDATCQTAAISISQDSASELSSEITTSKNLEDELDSRLNAILALKEVVFTQRMAIKESTKDKQRLFSKITQRDKINRKLLQRNKELERELTKVKKLLQAANAKLSQKQDREEEQIDVQVVETDDESTVGRRKEESIFDLLHRMNEKRKKQKKKSKALRSNALACQ